MKSFFKKMKPKAFHKSEKLLNIGKNQCCVVVMFQEEPLVPIPKTFMGSILVWVLIRFLFYIKLGPSSRSKSNFLMRGLILVPILFYFFKSSQFLILGQVLNNIPVRLHDTIYIIGNNAKEQTLIYKKIQIVTKLLQGQIKQK